jgi:hypothetical protein
MKYVLVKEGSIVVMCRDRVYVLKPETYKAIVNAHYDRAFESLECSDNLYAVVDYMGWRISFSILLSYYTTLFTRTLLVELMMI